MREEHKRREDWTVAEIVEHRQTGKRPELDPQDDEPQDPNEMSAEQHLERIQKERNR